MPNPSGINQHQTVLSAVELLPHLEALKEYRYKMPKLISKLATRGVHISKSTLKRRMKELGWSIRSELSSDDKRMLILEEIERTLRCSGVGPGFLRTTIFTKYGHNISREMIREVMKEVDPEAFIFRRPGHKIVVKRAPMFGVGPHAQWSCDGHDKLQHFNIRIYGFADNWSSYTLKLKIARTKDSKTTALHYLNVVEEQGGIPLTIITDRGTETVDIYAIQTALRQTFSDIPLASYPAHIYTTSTHNIVIERTWWQWLKTKGHWLKAKLSTEQSIMFNREHPLHMALFELIFFPLVRAEMDQWILDHNTHRVRKQKHKVLPSGGQRNQFLDEPETWGEINSLIPIPLEYIQPLKDTLIQENDAVDDLINLIGPQIDSTQEVNWSNAWSIFWQHVAVYQELVGDFGEPSFEEAEE
jgi:hypothetical protein